MCDSRQFSEDIVQETFVRATVNQELLGTLHENQVKSWLYKTARNVYIDAVRTGIFRESPDDIPEWTRVYKNISFQDITKEGVNITKLEMLDMLSNQVIGEFLE
jgi:RNA polymerase sigma-70 factor (ECF subfamily)